MMKTIQSHFKQFGFFDLGLGFALLAIFGTTAYVVSPDANVDKTQQIASCKQESNINDHVIKTCVNN